MAWHADHRAISTGGQDIGCVCSGRPSRRRYEPFSLRAKCGDAGMSPEAGPPAGARLCVRRGPEMRALPSGARGSPSASHNRMRTGQRIKDSLQIERRPADDLERRPWPSVAEETPITRARAPAHHRKGAFSYRDHRLVGKSLQESDLLLGKDPGSPGNRIAPIGLPSRIRGRHYAAKAHANRETFISNPESSASGIAAALRVRLRGWPHTRPGAIG